jgi:polysaccharide lyase-like protein
MLKIATRIFLAAAALTVVAAPPAQAWTATSLSSFKLIGPNCEGGSVTVSGGTFQFKKPGGVPRCEAKGASGITPAIGRTYTIQWNFKLNTTVNNNAIFQWKAYPTEGSLQNYPLVLKCISNKLVLQYGPPNSTPIYVSSTSIYANTTYAVKLQIYVSSSSSSGWVSYWLNGAQKINQYKARTFDSSSVEPKWGIYGATDTYVVDTISSLSMN